MVANASLLLNKKFSLFASLLFLFLFLALPALAGENIAAYPLLPSGYSSIKVFDREGRFVGRILPEGRYWTPIERIPVFLQKALVAVEDARFYEHGGIDVRGIARALVKDVVKGKLAEGGSTITQQLIKNKYLSGEKTIDRKLKEGLMAVEFEQKYTKKQILEMYFNEIYYGNGAWGIAQAARLYFDKNPEELTDAECALLAGVPKNPGRYNPRGDSVKVMGRRDIVLQADGGAKYDHRQTETAIAGPAGYLYPTEPGTVLPGPYQKQPHRNVRQGDHRAGRTGNNRRLGPEPAEAGGTDPA